MKTYYIYHIPNYKWKNGRIGKVGCTDDLKNRMYHYSKNILYEVIETHSDIYIASDREIELQKQYGYPVDKNPYWKSIKMPTKEGRIKSGKKKVESGHMAKMSALAHQARRTPILQYDKNGKFIKEWGSGKEAGDELGISPKNISHVVRGQRKTAGGFIWKYKE